MFLGQCFQACFWGFLAAPLPCMYLHLLWGCVAFPFFFFFLSLSAHKKKKKITLWQGFHPFLLSLSQVHSIVHIIHESGPSLRSRCSFLSRLQEGGCRSKQVTVSFRFVFLNVRLSLGPFSAAVPAAWSSQGWLICWGGDVALRLVIRWVLLLIAYLLTLAV